MNELMTRALLFRPCLLVLAVGMASACQGQVGNIPSGAGGSGSSTPGTGGAGNSPAGVGGAGNGSITGAGGVPMAIPISLDGDPQYYRLVRLTNEQWGRSTQDLLKLAAPSGLEAGFETAVAGTTDFSNNEHVLDVTQRSWGDFQMAAETLATQVTASDTTLARVYTGTADGTTFINTFGRRAFRRPLTSAETTRYMTVFSAGTMISGTRSSFLKGAEMVIRAMLQSPFFLYRTEMGTTGQPLSGYEMAAKLSLWLRGTTPSDALLDSAAGPGRLDTADGAVTLATTMLGEPAAATVMRKFHGELLDFDRYQTITKLNVPAYRAALNAEYEEVSYLFFDKIFTQGLGVREILTSQSGFVGPGLAPLYGVAAPTSGYVERDLGPRRVGYFSQLPYLTLHAINGEPHSILRGVTINLDILCADPGAAAPNLPPVPTLLPDQTNRERITALTGGCGGTCHNTFINPVGFAFEHFDGMGQYRDMENGKPIDSSGGYPFLEGYKTFADAGELMRAMADGEQAHTCYAKKIAGHALQRDIVAADMPMLAALKTASMATGGSLKQVMLELVRNPAFRTRVGGTP
jgi:hypothetical protein